MVEGCGLGCGGAESGGTRERNSSKIIQINLPPTPQQVLKKTPNNPSALYVHHFHEKIPSRQLSTNTTTSVLSSLISLHPAVPEYYRTRAMTHLFREEYNLAIRDFKMAIMLSK